MCQPWPAAALPPDPEPDPPEPEPDPLPEPEPLEPLPLPLPLEPEPLLPDPEPAELLLPEPEVPESLPELLDPSELVEESDPELLEPEVSEFVPLVSLPEFWFAFCPFDPEFDDPEPPSLPPSWEVPDSSPPPPPVTDFEISEVPGEMSASVRFSAMTTPPRPMPKAATPIATG